MSPKPPANVAPSPSVGANAAERILSRSGLDLLFEALRSEGYTLVGPTHRDGAIVLDELSLPSELPIGIRDLQAPGSYRTEQRGDEAAFGHVVGPHSYRRFIQVPRERLFQLRRKDKGFEVVDAAPPRRRLALFGARGCDIAALGVQDAVLRDGMVPDPHYAARRADVFVVAVACNEPAATCFCTSMGGSPTPTEPFDLSLRELLPDDSGPHRFLVTAASDAGRELLSKLSTTAARNSDLERDSELDAEARQLLGRTVDPRGIKELLYAAAEHPRWEQVAQRCLTCTSCTLVCPTCFCTRIEDRTALEGGTAERIRSWDSCFSLDYSYMHGGPARSSTAARYRQWLTHKFASWHDQFGSSGCVGCGRCISWCPAAIDVTEELAAIRNSPPPPRSKAI